jgi:hypothetical protein
MMNSMRNRPASAVLALATSLVLAACGPQAASEPLPATATLAPIVSLTPRFTATPIPSRTPLPSPTLTPSQTYTTAPPTSTFTASPTPPVLGSVFSVNDVNLREGPGVTFPLITALRPGTGFTVLATDTAGAWYNIRMQDGGEGWISATLVRLQPSETPLPSTTPTPDLTQMALGTPLPTSVLGGLPVTPTPPRAIATQILPTQTGPRPPDMQSIDQTATALAQEAGSLLQITPITGSVTPSGPVGGPTGGPLPSGSATPQAPLGNAQQGEGVDIVAYCDDPTVGRPAPRDIAAGSTADVYWWWYADTQAHLADHVAAAVYDVRLDGVRLEVSLMPVPRQEANGNWYQYYVARTRPLSAGEHRIDYSLTWRRAIFDGYANYGPGTSIVSNSGSCTFSVR